MKFRKFLTCAFSAIFATAIPAQASEKSVYWSDGDDWEVVSGNGECRLSQYRTITATGELVTNFVKYDAGDKLVTIGFVTPATSSLPDEGEMDLKIFLSGGNGNIDDGWGSRSFNYTKISFGHLFYTEFSGAANVSQILLDLSKWKHFAVFTQEEEVISVLNLSGSSVAIKHLRDCAFAADGLRSDDPFLK